MTGRKRRIDDLQGEIEELFADLWQVPRFSGIHRGFRPQYDCYRSDDPPTLTVVLELPGVDPDSVSILAVGRALSVSGKRERPTLPGVRYQAMEIDYGPFQRRIELGEDVDAGAATAAYERGMLTIVLPVSPRAPTERVPIEVRRR